MKLYEIRQEIENLMNLIDEDGTIEESSFAQLEELAIAEEDKLENIGLLLKNWTAEAKAIRDEEVALAARRKAIENQGQRLSDYASDYMLKINRAELKTPRVRLSFRRSVAVDITDESLIPEDFIKIERKVSKSDIGRALKAGLAVAGAVLLERQNLQVK